MEEKNEQPNEQTLWVTHLKSQYRCCSESKYEFVNETVQLPSQPPQFTRPELAQSGCCWPLFWTNKKPVPKQDVISQLISIMHPVGIDLAKLHQTPNGQLKALLTDGALFNLLLDNAQLGSLSAAFVRLQIVLYVALLRQNESGDLLYWDNLFQKNHTVRDQYAFLLKYCYWILALLQQRAGALLPISPVLLTEERLSRVENINLDRLASLSFPDTVKADYENKVNRLNRWHSGLSAIKCGVAAALPFFLFLGLGYGMPWAPAAIGLFVLFIGLYLVTKKIKTKRMQLISDSEAFAPGLFPEFAVQLREISAAAELINAPAQQQASPGLKY